MNAIFSVLRGGIAWRLLPTDLPPDTYFLLMGLYNPHTGERIADMREQTVRTVGTLEWDGTTWRVIE